MREALHNRRFCLVTIRNYRKDGSMFWNELSISPVFDKSGSITHFIGIQNDVTARINLEYRLTQERLLLEQSKTALEKLVTHDILTGIYNRRFFEDQFYAYYDHQSNSQIQLTLMCIYVDYFKRFNYIYGHLAGDSALKKIADILYNS